MAVENEGSEKKQIVDLQLMATSLSVGRSLLHSFGSGLSLRNSQDVDFRGRKERSTTICHFASRIRLTRNEPAAYSVAQFQIGLEGEQSTAVRLVQLSQIDSFRGSNSDCDQGRKLGEKRNKVAIYEKCAM